LSGRLATLVSFEDIRRLIAESVAEALQVSHITLYVWEDERVHTRPATCPISRRAAFRTSRGPIPDPFIEEDGKPLSDYSLDMMSRRGDGTGIPQAFRDLDASLIIPMIARDEVIGLIVLGQKKSGQLFVYEDVELLTTIANQSAVALEKARIYGELEQLNQALEKKVEERTAALRQAMEATEKARAQLVRSESLAAIGQLVAGTAHELNNPLASASSLIQTSLETIREGNLQEEDRKEIVDDLDFSLVEVKRASDIVKSLLSLSRQTSTYMEPVNLNTVMDDALRVLHSQFKHLPLQITRCYDMNLPQIDGNFANLGQVFINVIKNAIQALPKGRRDRFDHIL
jgi:two-component system NtrC family sensor kinase